MWERGEFVTINGRVAVVVATGAELGEALSDHTAVWFGKAGEGPPEVWTIPTEYLNPGPEPVVRH